MRWATLPLRLHTPAPKPYSVSLAIARASASSPDDITEALLAAEARTQPDMPRPAGVPQNLDDVSRLAIRQALEAARGNMSAAARTLGISRQTLYRKLAVH